MRRPAVGVAPLPSGLTVRAGVLRGFAKDVSPAGRLGESRAARGRAARGMEDAGVGQKAIASRPAQPLAVGERYLRPASGADRGQGGVADVATSDQRPAARQRQHAIFRLRLGQYHEVCQLRIGAMLRRHNGLGIGWTEDHAILHTRPGGATGKDKTSPQRPAMKVESERASATKALYPYAVRLLVDAVGGSAFEHHVPRQVAG